MRQLLSTALRLRHGKVQSSLPEQLMAVFMQVRKHATGKGWEPAVLFDRQGRPSLTTAHLPCPLPAACSTTATWTAPTAWRSSTA